MKKQILILLRYSLFPVLFLSTTAMAMDQKNDLEKVSSIVRKLSLSHPVPPTITYQEYVNNLCLANGEIGRWGKPKGNLAGWLQAPANKKKLEDLDGNPLGDFPLFQVTLNPVVDETRLRCDYSLPAADSDLSKGTATLSLFSDATVEEIEAVALLKSESIPEYTARLLQWQEMLRKKQQVSKAVVSRLLNSKFIPEVFTISNLEDVSRVFPHQQARNEKGFFYYNFDGATMQLKTKLQLIDSYTPELYVDEVKQKGKKHNLYPTGLNNISGSVDYLYADSSIGLTVPYNSFSLSGCLFDVNGDFNIKIKSISFTNVYFWPIGKLVFRPIEQNCPIDKIKITAANSAKPILVSGHLNFNEIPTVNLECVNATRIDLKFKAQK